MQPNINSNPFYNPPKTKQNKTFGSQNPKEVLRILSELWAEMCKP